MLKRRQCHGTLTTELVVGGALRNPAQIEPNKKKLGTRPTIIIIDLCDLHYAAAATDPQLTQPHLQATNGRKTSDQWKKDMQRCAFHIRRKHATMCFHIKSAFVLSKTTQAPPAQSTHSSFSPEISDAADPTQPLAKAADTAKKCEMPQ